MAEWNYNNINHPLYGLNVPPSFHPQFTSPNNHLHYTFNMPPSCAPMNYYLGSNPSQDEKTKWLQFESELTQGSSHPLTSNVFRYYVDGNRTGETPILSETQWKWLSMVNQRRLDQNFLDSFTRARLVPQSRPSLVKLSEFRDLVEESKRLTSNLKSIQAVEECRSPKESPEVAVIKERLEFVVEQLSDRAISKEVKEKVKKRKEKRKWIQRKKERQRKEAELALVRRDHLNKLIDDQREDLRRKELSLKKGQEARREADAFLSEVRRKQNEAKRLKKMMQALRELRRLRARSLESRCGLYSKEEDTKYFNSTIEKLELLIQRQTEIYEKEEETLRTMMDIRHKSKKTEDAIQTQWNACSLKIITNKC